MTAVDDVFNERAFRELQDQIAAMDKRIEALEASHIPIKGEVTEGQRIKWFQGDCRTIGDGK